MISLPWPKERKTLKLQKNIVAKAIKHKNCIKLLKYVQGIVKVSFFYYFNFFLLFVISQLPRQMSVMYDQYMNVSLK